jgi:dihydrofolate synthase/folylpolyglutamate synthase
MYHRIGSAAYKEGLENIENLAAMAGHPEKKLKAIHIAGTNGKGSVAHLLASYFQELGWKTGLFTSPHLIDFRERIKINGKMIPEQKVIHFFEKYKEELANISPSFFEMTTILAFDFFAAEKVDIAIIEVGLGGRLDATNILSPILSVITNISLDHIQLLGDSLSKIAFEKAGIIKENIPIIIGECHPETFPVFENTAKLKNAPLYLAEEYSGELQFGADYQQKNLAIFFKCLELFEAERRKQNEKHYYGLTVLQSYTLLKNTIQNLHQNTGFLGRWQIVSEKPFTICDVAHNPAGIELVMKQLITLPHNHLHIVLGFVNDKDLEVIIPLLPKDATYYACQAKIERALSTEELFRKLSQSNFNVIKVSTVLEAYNQAKTNAQENDVIFVGGSFYVVGEFLLGKREHCKRYSN